MGNLMCKPLEKAVDLLLEASIRQIDYIINYEDYVEGLKELDGKLEQNELTVRQLVDAAENNAEEITPTTQDWRNRVAAKREESKEFRDDRTLKSKTSCFAGGCSSGALPFLWHRRQLGRKAKILAPAIKELNDETPDSANISYRQAPTFEDRNPSGDDYLKFESRKGTIEKVMEQLKDSTVRIVGLHGPSGVGKTSLIQQIAKQAKGRFDKVAMATVKKDPDLQKVQQDIADHLGLTFGDEGQKGRAALLRKRLKKENTLVILDDLWDELDLNEIGIPFDNDDVSSHVMRQERTEGEEQTTTRGCKIFITSRYKEVLRNKMNVKEKSVVLVPELDIEETLTLFKKVVGLSNENPKFKPETLHKYCAGLPMAVILVGKSLQNKSESEWEGELERLKNQQESNEVQKYMEKHVMMGYDLLASEELKSTFLMCAQMGHPSLIADLVKYCYGLGTLKDVHTLRDAHKTISESIQKLKDLGLLDSTSNDSFNMHDIIRDAALSMACKNQNVFILRNKTLDVWPHKKELQSCTGIHLYKSQIVVELPEVLNSPQLKFFHIDTDDSSLEIPDRFFEKMEELRVLVLSGIHLPSLPSSIKCLSNLRMLCLENCTLGNLSIINKLKNLRILSLSGSRIEDWPTELEGLCRLQLLDISDCSISRLTRPLSLSSFTSLEELHIRNSLTKMEVEEEVNRSQTSVLSELKHLHQLNSIDVCIPSAEVLPADLFFHELNDYKIVIGDFETISIEDFKIPNKYEASRSLALQLERGMDIHSLKGVKLLFKGVVNLLLGELHGVQNAFYELNLNGFPDLKHLSIANNKGIEYIVNSMELSQPQDAFPSLEFLSLFNLKNIKNICCSPITNSSFSRLKTIKVQMCPQLKNIFFFYIVKFLTSLETIYVSDCDSLQAVVGEEGEGSNKVVLYKLCSLTLQKLPSFVSFCEIDDREILPAEDEKSLFEENVEIPKLEILKLFSIKIHRIWNNWPSNDWFQNLIKLTLDDCCNLTYLCSLSVARCLNKLKSISIGSCPLMEKLFIIGGNKNECSKVCIFPKLEEIELFSMEMLQKIWPGEDEVSADSFPSLVSVNINYCNKLDKIFPDHTKCWYMHLKSLKVYWCKSVEFIFESRHPPQQNDTKSALLELIDLRYLPYLKQVWSVDPKGVVNFANLQSIKISDCNTLRNVLPASIAKDLGKLESFSITSSHELEEIIAWDTGSETSNEPPLKFPEVVSMSFSKLPSIRCFYKGRHIVECPKLKQLTVTACPNLEIFKTESANEEEIAFLSAEKVIFKLEHLHIDSRNVRWLVSNRGKYRLNSLTHLHLEEWASIDETLYCFLHTIPNLQILESSISWGIREFVPSGNTGPQQRLGTVLLLKELILNTSNVEDIGFERDPALQRSLHRLVLTDCRTLRRLAHSSVSFTHLTYLQVYSCDELKTLMACSTAKSLVQLTTLKVNYCRQLNEIVTKDEQENDEGIKIVFANLITIELEQLSNLTSFCSIANCEFSVPSLEKLILRDCPKMKTFTAKRIRAPRLQCVLASESSDEEGKGYWEGDLNATIQMVFADKVHLELSNHPELKQVWCDKTLVQVNRFQNVKSLVLKRCGYVVHVIPSHLLHCFKNLEDLQVSDCHGVQVIFNMDDISNKQVTKAMGMSGLKNLSLENLPNLKHVWDKDPKGTFHLQALQDFSIDRCDSLEYVFPSSITKGLAMNNLSIKNCEQLVKIFSEDKTTSELEDTISIVFGSLTSLCLTGVPLLKYFYPGLHKLQFQKLKRLYIQACKWMIFNCEEAEAYIDQQVIVPPLEQVNLLFQSLEKLSFDIRGAKLTWEVKSGKLGFEESEEERVEEVLFEEKPKADYVEFLSHLPLKGLSMSSLLRLKSIGFDHSWIHPILDNIQTLEVNTCFYIKNYLVPSKVSFSSLTKLIVNYCNDLLYLFTSSTAKSLSQLKHMEISNCRSMREIICKEDDESNENIIFEQLQVLHLRDLPMLRWLYSGKRTLCFPSLQQLFMFGKLSTMATFCPHIQIDLDSVKLSSGQNYWNPYEVQWEDDVDTTIRKINNKEIGLRESLYFQDMWRGSMPIPEAYFGNLESLIVHQCEFLSEVIPLHLLPSLNNMRTLKVQKCSSVKTIFDVKCITKNKTLLPIKFSLKELVLEKLPNLDSIWNEDPDGVLDFQLIQEMHVDTCKSLTSLFPKSVGKDLVNLKNLELKHCEGLVEIIAGIETTPEEAISNLIKLPRLTSLTLLDLPSFNCFYCSLHCVLMKTLNGHDPQIEDQVSFKEVTPKLTNMLFGEREAKMIGHEECDGSHFGDINVPDMQSFNVELESDELPYTFLQKVSCIKTLQLKNSSIKEIFCSKRPNLDCTQFLPHLKELKLASLSELISIGFECSWILESSILKTLVTLEVKSCSGLTSLVSSPVCFSNLTHLTVSECDSMIYLFTSATAKSLFQLKEMKISNCKSMEWIMSNEGEESIHDEIVFEQLQELRFESLKNLRRFYNGDFALSFPSLEKLKVIKCNRMEYFCEGTINTNKLSEVVFDDSFRGDRTPLEVDLNSTLRNTYKTEVAKFVREVKDLKLSEHPMIHGIWNDPFRVPSLCFIRLKILIVEKCEFITSIVIPSHILSLLCKLEELVVRQCDSVKKIFEVTHEAKDTMINPLRSGLKKLTIEQLPNLEHVWDSDPAQQISYFQSFQEVYVHGCNNLQRLFPTSVAENLNKLEKLEVIECDRLVEIVTKDEVVVEGAPKEFALQSMTSIKLWSLPELKCFYPAPHKLECPKLEEVHLFHCEKLKIFQFESQEFQCPQAENEAIFLPEKVIPYLKFLAVSKEEIMMMLHGQFHVNNLSKLEALQLQCFHDDSDTFSYEVLGQLPNIENLAVNCSSFKEIFYSQSPNMDDGKGILPHLKCLQLIKLSKLKSIGLEYAWMDLISKNLEKLLIDQCHCLRSIVPSKVSFSSLIELNISECNGLVSLFTPSTSRTLHQLKNMSVKDCESLEEIVSKETEESSELVEEEIIVFPELKTLSLCSLPNLGRFYNGNTALKFPLLDKFSLIDCQKMESFCAGAVSVNRWTEVEFEEDKDPVLLEVDLNSAIPKAFEGMFY
ncbi:uncharacterized protein LOC107626019 isoform X1 [Arachis ipaensis]|uniref:uncharacterized protein LOC107626019 isoform X1 n=1 Tax=Arachis ipaensis TaxID=130454 RepID=UPI000A2B141F|nr:uncharacterized protein LOC107626019 isoform X1 [Arachis ipaensis]XP_020972031.1 uncharacterized protein LOC107626019 isoform X1 [Arachis ipaensis]